MKHLGNLNEQARDNHESGFFLPTHVYTHMCNCHQLQSRWQAYEDHAKRLKQQEERKKAKELEEKEKRKRRREKLFLLLQSREEGKMVWI